MLASFPAPVLSVTADAVRDLQGHEALSGLWTLFTKCKESLQDGRRLENISWRLWHRELVHAHARAQSSSSSSVLCPSYQPLTPVSVTPNQPDDSGRSSPAPTELPGIAFDPNNNVATPGSNVIILSHPQLHTASHPRSDGITALGLPSPTSDGDRDRPVVPTNVFASSIPLVLDTAVASLTTMTVTGTSSSLTRNLKSHCVGRVIVEMLPNHFDIPKPRPRVVSARPSASTSYPQRPPSPAPSHASQASHEPPPSSVPASSFLSTPHHPVSSSQLLASHDQIHQAPPTPTSTSASQLALSHTCMQPQVHPILKPSALPPLIAYAFEIQGNDKSYTLRAQDPPLVKLPSNTPPFVTAITPSVSVAASPSEQGNVGTSTTTTAPNTFPRVIVVNPTPHPTPPMTPIFGGTAASNDVSFGAAAADGGGAGNTIKPAYLLPPLPLPGPAVFSGAAGTGRGTHVQTPMLSQSTNLSPAAATTFPYSPVPDASVSLSSARPTDTDMCAILGGASVGVGVSMARTPGETRRFFLQQSPDDISPDRDEDKVHRKRDSSQESKNLCSPVSGGKSEMGAMSVVEDRDEGKIRRASLDGGAGGFGRGASRLLVGRRQRSRQGRHAHTASKTKMKTGGVVKERGKGKERVCAEPEHCTEDEHGDEDGDGHEDRNEDEEDEDKRSMSALTNNMVSRTQRGKGKDTGVGVKVSAARLRRAHSARNPTGLLAHGHGAGHVAPLMQKRSSMHEGEHQPYQQQHKAMFNIGSGSSGGSKSTQSTNAPVYILDHAPRDSARAQVQTTMRGLIADTSVKPPLSLVATTTTTMVPGVNALPNGCASQSNATITTDASHHDKHSNAVVSTDANNIQPNGVQQQSQQGRKTIVVASTSEEYETTDGSDSEWASEEIDDAEKKHRAKDSNNKLHATSTKTGHPSKPNATPKATEEETHLREAALEAQRQRDLFAKVPKRSYSNLNRTQSGLLSQLMNPNPVVFQVGHPYRPTRSSQDIGKMGLTMTQAQGQVQESQQHLDHIPRTRVPQRSNSAFAAPTTRLSTSKSTAALPMAAQVFAISSSKPASSGVPRSADDNDKAGKNEKSGGYRPKGRPQEEEMEDDSEEENEHDQIPVSRSVAQEKLQALMTRRSSSQRQQQQQGERPGKDETVRTSLLITGVANYAVSGPVTSLTSTSSAVAMATPTPIPLGHPYNLPAPAPPMTPRTTRRRMLRTELSESMRRQLLWERQVSSTTNPAAAARRTSQGGLRPLATTTASESASPARGGAGSGANGTGELVNANEDREERRRRALSRNWTWADDYHFAGW